MPRIPTSATNVQDPSVQVPYTRLRDTAPPPDQSSNNELKQLGSQMENFGRTVNQIDLDQSNITRERTVANAAATFDFTPVYTGLQTAAAPGAPGFATDVTDAFRQTVQQHVDDQNITDPIARTDLTQKLMSQQPEWSKNAADFQVKQSGVKANQDTSTALDTLDNKTRSDPVGEFDKSLSDGINVINAANVPEAEKPGMIQAFKGQQATQRFMALGVQATDPDQLGAIVKDLQDPSKPWQSYMTSQQFDSTLTKLKTDQATLQKAVEAQATTQVAGIREQTRGTNPVAIPDGTMLDVGQLVRKSKNAALQTEYAELQVQQNVIKQHSADPPEVLRALIQSNRAFSSTAQPSIPPAMQGPIEQASAATGGKISSAYIAGMLSKENAGVLQGQPAAQGNGGGAGQFIPSTWMGMLPRLGVDTTGMSDQQKLDLRNNVGLNLKASAMLAADNKATMEGALGRPVSDGEVYLAHFLGAGGGGAGTNKAGALDLIKALGTQPQATAASILPAAAAANPQVFNDKSGKPLTVGQLYNSEVLAFGSTPTRVGYAENDQLRKVYQHQQEQLGKDPMTFATTVPGARFPSIGLDQPAAAGQNAQQIADFYGIPHADMKPLTQDQSDHITKIVKDGTVEDQQNVMGVLQQLGPTMASAAFKQVGETSPVFSLAAGLQQTNPAPGVVADVLRGGKTMQDKGIADSAAMKSTDMRTEFDKTFGPALSKLDGPDRQAIYDAARQHYAQTTAVNNPAQSFDANAFGKSVNAVLGANGGQAGVGNVNGAPTVVPPGLTAQQFDTAVHKMTDQDFQALSLTGAPPRFANGQVATAQQIQSEGRFQAWKGGNYLVLMSNGAPLVSGATPRGLTPYLMQAKPDVLQRILARPGAAAETSNVPPIGAEP